MWSSMALHVVLHVVVNCLLHLLDLLEVGVFLGFLIPAAVEDPAKVSVNLKVRGPIVPEPMLEIKFTLGVALAEKEYTY